MKKQQLGSQLSETERSKIEQEVAQTIDMAWRRAIAEPQPEEPPLPSQVLSIWHSLLDQVNQLQKESETRLAQIQTMLKKYQ
jgi:TPP-dependent pyruvate/acetoin dehydrogenase alpha subunit